MHLLIRTISDTGNHYTIICDKPTEECSNQKPCQYTTFLDNLCGEALLHSLPVDNLPDGLEVLGLAVLVLQTVECVCISYCSPALDGRASKGYLLISMLPGVNAKKRLELTNNRVLVLIRS